MQEKRMMLDVRTLRPEGDLAPEDRGLAGVWGVTLTGPLLSKPDPKPLALDIFHAVVPISVLEDFEIEASEAAEPVIGTELGRFSRVPDAPFVDRLLDQAFGSALKFALPDMPEDALVYEVDGGEPGDPNTVIRAAVFDRGIPDEVRMIGEPIVLTVSKAWLTEVMGRSSAPDGPEP